MALLQEAKMETGYLKAGFLGFAGAGKTHTAFLLAMGLLEELGDDRPIAMVDTEAGSDWWLPRLEEGGRKLLVVKSRAFRDLLAAGQEAEGQCSLFLVDSISHIWKELLESFQRSQNISRLAFHHWNVLKPEWARFTDWMLNSHIHVIIAGRAGYEYDYEEDEQGKKELVKTGTKMKAESEFGFEPSLLVEMMKIKHSVVSRDPDAKGWVHRAFILKDRADRMNGMEIDNPTYESFRPHINAINLGGAHRVIDADRKSDDMFDDRDKSLYQRKKRREIALEEIKEAFVLAGKAGRSDAAKQFLSHTLNDLFGTPSWKAISGMDPDELEYGLQKLKVQLGLAPPPEVEDDKLPWEEEEEEEVTEKAEQDPKEEAPPLEEPEADAAELQKKLEEKRKDNDVVGEEAVTRKQKKHARYMVLWNDKVGADDSFRHRWQRAAINKKSTKSWKLSDYDDAIALLEGEDQAWAQFLAPGSGNGEEEELFD